MNKDKRTFIKVTKKAKDTKIESCDFEGDFTHIENEGENTQMKDNKHRPGKDSPPSNSFKITR